MVELVVELVRAGGDPVDPVRACEPSVWTIRNSLVRADRQGSRREAKSAAAGAAERVASPGLSKSVQRGEADRARTILPTLAAQGAGNLAAVVFLAEACGGYGRCQPQANRPDRGTARQWA